MEDKGDGLLSKGIIDTGLFTEEDDSIWETMKSIHTKICFRYSKVQRYLSRVV